MYISKRNEWVRKMDVDGKPFWYRNPTNSGAAMFPGFVAIFKPSEKAVSPDSDKGLLGEDGIERIQQTVELVDEAEAAVLEIVPSNDADAAAFALGVALNSTERMQETIALAANDFPTKYAHFVVATSTMVIPAQVAYLKLSVNRDFVLEQSMEHISCIEEKNVRSIMRINFLDESGVDAGGLHREWFMILNELLMDPSIGLFTCVNTRDQTYYLNPNSKQDNGEDHLIYLFAAGRLLGRALLEGNVTGFHLSTPLLKILLGQPVSFSDMEYYDPDGYKSLLWIAEHDGVDSLGLDFSVCERRKGPDGEIVEIVDLVPNGRHVAMTDANKHEYLQRKFQYTLFESVAPQLFALLKGVYQVIPPYLLMTLDAEEFDFLLCGSQDIDVDDWEKNTKLSADLVASAVVRWFWEIVREMPHEYQRRLLQFATGLSRVPLVGFKGLTSYDGRICPFALKGTLLSSSQYIRSHACFNRLDLPFFTTREELHRVLYATLSTESYGFTIV
jgi:hypothetical protein